MRQLNITKFSENKHLLDNLKDFNTVYNIGGSSRYNVIISKIWLFKYWYYWKVVDGKKTIGRSNRLFKDIISCVDNLRLVNKLLRYWL